MLHGPCALDASRRHRVWCRWKGTEPDGDREKIVRRSFGLSRENRLSHLTGSKPTANYQPSHPIPCRSPDDSTRAQPPVFLVSIVVKGALRLPGASGKTYQAWEKQQGLFARSANKQGMVHTTLASTAYKTSTY